MRVSTGLLIMAIASTVGCSTLSFKGAQAPSLIVESSIGGDLSCPETPSIGSVASALHISGDALESVLRHRGISLKDYCDSSATKKINHLTKGAVPRTPQFPGGADQQFRLQRMHGGDVAGHQERYAIAAKEAFEEREAALADMRSRHEFLPKGAAVWESLGPGNVGGRIRSLLVDPTNPDVVWLGAVTGGVWKSTDGGNSWRSTTDALGYIGIFDLTMMPGNPNTVFATTGEYANSSGPGILVTNDGGSSWRLMKPTGPAGMALASARNLVIHPTQTNQMVVSAAGRGIWGSSDSGMTWQQRLPTAVTSSPTFMGVNRLRQDPNNPNNLIASKSYRGILISADFGLTWAYANGFGDNNQSNYAEVEIAFAKSVPGRVFASITAKSGDANARYEVWRSDNGGKDWTFVNRAATPEWGPSSRNQGNYNHVLWVNPTNANHLLLGEIVMLQSLDGGKTWASIDDYATRLAAHLNSPFPLAPYENGGRNTGLHPDHHVIYSDPNFNGTTNRRVWFGNDGGIWRADDVTQLRVYTGAVADYQTRVGALKYLNNDLRITQSYFVNGSAWLGGAILTGLQDNGTTMYRGNAANWWQATGGDGMRAAFNPNNPFQFLTTYQQGAVLQVTLSERGVTSKQLWAGSSTDPFYTFIEHNVNNPNRVYMMNTSLWASDDIWSAAPTRRQILGPDPINAQNNIVAAAIAPSKANVVWAVRQSKGIVHKTVNALDNIPSWQTFNLPVGEYGYGSRIFIDPVDSDRVYVIFSSSGARQNILRTLDGGFTWQDLTGSLGNRYIYTVTQHPLKNSLLYAGTEFGLYVSDTDGASWKLAPELAPGVAVEDLQWFDNRTLLIATYGRGVFRVSNPSADIVGYGVSQNISFPPGQSIRLSVGTTTPTAEASSKLPVNFTSLTPSVCLATDSIVTLINVGSCTLRAFQVGDHNYLPAEPVTQTVEVIGLSAQLVTSFLPAASVGQSFLSRLLISGSPLPSSVTVSGLPAGLTANYDSLGNLTVSGSTNAPPGTYSVSIRYTNAVESATLSASIEVLGGAGAPSSRASGISVGRSHSCAVVDGRAQCWGANSFGQLGTGNYTARSRPTQISFGSVLVTSVSAGGYHSCAVVDSGLQCWGLNHYGQLGNGGNVSSNNPVQAFPSGSNVTSISLGDNHTCAVVSGGVQCWGFNFYGQLGSGNTTNLSSPTWILAANSDVTNISTGVYHTCAVVSGGVKCWGNGTWGQLGNGSTVTALAPVQAIPAGSGASVVAVGQGHTCAVVNGGLRCWGIGADGRLGQGTTNSSSIPLQIVPPGSGVTAVAAGARHTCFVMDGGLRCMGANPTGQLGIDGANPSWIPLQIIAAKTGVTDVSAGTGHTCAVVAGQVLCWGDTSSGQVGTGYVSVLPPMVSVAAGNGAYAVATYDGQTCAVLSGGVKCWGSNEAGLGDGASTYSTTAVTVMEASSNVSSLALGNQHACAVSRGALFCWGEGRAGQVGNMTNMSATRPVQVIASNVEQVAAGYAHTCAVVRGGVQCWGIGGNGQLGNGNPPSSSAPIQAIAAGSNVVSIAAGASHTCAVMSGGVKCWGSNGAGQLGNNSTNDSFIPVQSLPTGSGAT